MKIFVYGEVWFLALAAFLTRFWNLSFPNWVVFDEAHFGLYATKYLSHEYFFDLHPPLGKMIFGFMAWLGNATPGFDFMHGTPYLDSSYIAMRFAPAFLGALLVPLIYVFMRQLGFSRRAGFVAGFLVLFENALIVESRFVLMDMILIFFIFLALSLFVLAKKNVAGSKKWLGWNAATGLLLGAAISIKWIGVGAFVMVWALLVGEQKIFSKRKARIALTILLLGFLPEDIDIKNVAATMKDGVLTLRLPKLHLEKTKQVKIEKG